MEIGDLLNKEFKYVIAFVIPIALILISVVRPIYFFLNYSNVVEATMVGTTEIEIDFLENPIKRRIGVFEYEINGEVFKQPFGKKVDKSEEKELIGTKKRIRVHSENPQKIYRLIPYDFADFIFLFFGLVFLIAIILYKEELNL